MHRAPVGPVLARTIENARRDGARVSLVKGGSRWAGADRGCRGCGGGGAHLYVARQARHLPHPGALRGASQQSHDETVRYVSLVHELAHLYGGHLGTPNANWWPDRQCLDDRVMEFEAESVAYLVCKRRDLEPPSARYLADHLENQPEILPFSLDRVMAAAGLIEGMGARRLPMRPRRHRPGERPGPGGRSPAVCSQRGRRTLAASSRRGVAPPPSRLVVAKPEAS